MSIAATLQKLAPVALSAQLLQGVEYLVRFGLAPVDNVHLDRQATRQVLRPLALTLGGRPHIPRRASTMRSPHTSHVTTGTDKSGCPSWCRISTSWIVFGTRQIAYDKQVDGLYHRLADK